MGDAVSYGKGTVKALSRPELYQGISSGGHREKSKNWLNK